jgi:hypothetical protein
MHSRAFRLVRSVVFVALVGVAFCAVRAPRVRAADADAMGGHMRMTALRPMQPGDQARADAIVAAARKFADRYTDYRKALADGYTIFHPELPQNVYHFTNNAKAAAATLVFDPDEPTSLLYERVAAAKKGEQPGYKLVGVMYTAPYRAPESELDRRVPLSIARWHLHTNLCLPPVGKRDVVGLAGGKFGLQGSITTAEACNAEGGRFLPHIFGWMVHVYPYETSPAKIWAAGMDDEHGMQHDDMPAGMPM